MFASIATDLTWSLGRLLSAGRQCGTTPARTSGL